MEKGDGGPLVTGATFRFAVGPKRKRRVRAGGSVVSDFDGIRGVDFTVSWRLELVGEVSSSLAVMSLDFMFFLNLRHREYLCESPFGTPLIGNFGCDVSDGTTRSIPPNSVGLLSCVTLAGPIFGSEASQNIVFSKGVLGLRRRGGGRRLDLSLLGVRPREGSPGMFDGRVSLMASGCAIALRSLSVRFGRVLDFVFMESLILDSLSGKRRSGTVG